MAQATVAMGRMRATASLDQLCDRFSSSGSLAILMAMRRASLEIETKFLQAN
jgi:hypothetical protein